VVEGDRSIIQRCMAELTIWFKRWRVICMALALSDICVGWRAYLLSLFRYTTAKWTSALCCKIDGIVCQSLTFYTERSARCLGFPTQNTQKSLRQTLHMESCMCHIVTDIDLSLQCYSSSSGGGPVSSYLSSLRRRERQICLLCFPVTLSLWSN